MKKNIKKLLLLSLISPFVASCVSDKGTYDYQEINEIKISNIEENYAVLQGVENLHIEPLIVSSLTKNETADYSYKWEVGKEVVSTKQVLDYIADLEKGGYVLNFRVTDNKTGIQYAKRTNLSVAYPYTRGFVVMGDDKEGYAQIDMVAMVENKDTLILKDMLKDSKMPKFKGARKVVNTGSYYNNTWIKMWAIGEKSFFCDSTTFNSSSTNEINSMLFTALPIPSDLSVVNVEPMAMKGGSTATSRVMICNNGWVFKSTAMEGDFYGNPVNFEKGKDITRCFKTSPYIFYSAGYFSGGFLLYDTDDERFMKVTSYATESATFADAEESVFPWNNKGAGRTLKYGENTMNKDGGSSYGNSFALMSNKTNDALWIYKLYASGGNGLKRDAYEVKTSIATNITQAKNFAFASNRTVLLYSIGNKLYAYDYNKGNEKLYDLAIGNGTDEITMIQFDIQTKDATFNDLYVATYNEATGGTLRRVTLVVNDPNSLNIILDPNAKWDGLCKVKDIDWRNS